MARKTIQVSEETYKLLISKKVEMMKEEGTHLSFDEVLCLLLNNKGV